MIEINKTNLTYNPWQSVWTIPLKDHVLELRSLEPEPEEEVTASALVEEGEIIQTTMQNCHCSIGKFNQMQP